MKIKERKRGDSLSYLLPDAIDGAPPLVEG
jgi:hypothetical protein